MKFSFTKPIPKQDEEKKNDDDNDIEINNISNKPKMHLNSPNKSKQSTLKCFQLNENENDNDNFKDPCTIFKENYKIAITSAENGNFAQSLRSFDLAIRFWGICSEKLQERYPNEYQKLNFPDINNSLHVSDYFLNVKKNDCQNFKKTKKKLWKPPPKHQPLTNDVDNPYIDNVLINAMNEFSPLQNQKFVKDHKVESKNDNDDDDDDDVDLIEDKDNEQIIKWKEELMEHRKIGSEMFEYHGQVLIEMDRDFDAIKSCQSAILLNDLNAMNWLTLSRAELNFGDPFQALKSIEKALQLNFDDNEIIEQYSYIYSITNKLSKNKFEIKRRYIIKNDKNENIKSDVKAIKQRLQNREMTKRKL